MGNFVWAKQMGGLDFDYGRSIAVDTLGNVYTTGYFNGTADFDPGAGVSNLTSAGNTDIFVSKLSPPVLSVPTASPPLLLVLGLLLVLTGVWSVRRHKASEH